MGSQNMKIQFYNLSIEEFISTLEIRTTARVFRMINILSADGPRLVMPHSKKLGHHLFELRIRGEQEIRLIYTFYRGQIIILHGFVKKSQKLPRVELNIARRRLRRLDSL